MSDIDKIMKEFYAKHDKFSIRTTWHNQHVIENILDLQGFISSISENLEDEKLLEPFHYPLGYFQIEQPSRIRYSQIIFLYVILERRLRALVKLTIEQMLIENDLSNYKGSFLDRVKLFLKDNLNIDISKNMTWESVMKFQKIRDCIIHCGGNIFESRDNNYLVNLVKEKMIEINDNGYMRISAELCGEMEGVIIDFISKGLETLYAELIKLEENKNNA